MRSASVRIPMLASPWDSFGLFQRGTNQKLLLLSSTLQRPKALAKRS
jgi:hypothetical protein